MIFRLHELKQATPVPAYNRMKTQQPNIFHSHNADADIHGYQIANSKRVTHKNEYRLSR